MIKPEGYRTRAAEVTQLATAAADADERRRLQERETALTQMADNEQWVIENYDKTLHAPAKPDRVDLKADEEHVVKCLGMAVIMQWNALSTELQRKLFDDAGSMGGLDQSEALRGLIARFLHKHKDRADDIVPGDQPRPGMGAA